MKSFTLIGMPEATWLESDQDKINSAFQKFTGSNSGVPWVKWRVKANPQNKWLIACYWTQHLIQFADKIDQDKIDALKAKLANQQIRIVFSDNPQADLDALGLEPDITGDGP